MVVEQDRAPRRDFDRVEPRAREAREDFDAPAPEKPRIKRYRAPPSDHPSARAARESRARAKAGEPARPRGRKDVDAEAAIKAAAVSPELVARLGVMTEDEMRAEMRKHVGLAVNTIVDIMANGHKEPSRLAAARYVVLYAFAPTPGVRPEPPGKKEQAEIDARAALGVPDSEWGNDLAGRASVN